MHSSFLAFLLLYAFCHRLFWQFYSFNLRFSCKFNPAFRTLNQNFAFAARHSDFLFTGRTFVNMMRLWLLESPLYLRKPLFYLIFILHIFIVFKAPPIGILRHHPKPGITKAYKCQYINKRNPEHGKNQKDHGKNRQKSVKPVISVPAHHKTIYFFSHGITPSDSSDFQ